MASKAKGDGRLRRRDMSSSFEPSINLVNEAKAHIGFLREVNSITQLHRDHVIRNAIRRYETIWLPLLADHEGDELEPPLDVHWMWHVHMLSPRRYIDDCGKLINTVPDHRLRPIPFDRDGAKENARRLWREHYPDEPFTLNYNDIPRDSHFSSQIEYDILGAAKRQKCFFYHVSLPHFLDTVFLSKAVERYKKFIALKKSHQNAYVVPMYDVDLIWHTHQLYPTAYKKDTTWFLGYVLNHDDSTIDRSPGSKLAQSDKLTRRLWSESYGEAFPVSGAMYRGENPRGRIDVIPKEDYIEFADKHYTVKIEKVKFENLAPDHRVCGKIIVDRSGSSSKVMKKLRLKTGEYEWSRSTIPEGVLSFDLDSSTLCTLYVTAKTKDGLTGILFGDGRTLRSCHFKISEICDKLNPSVATHNLKLESGEGDDGLRITMAATVTFRRKRQQFLLGRELFEEKVVPNDTQSFWGPITLPRLPEGFANKCWVGEHKISNFKEEVIFTVRILHSIPLRMSAVQVYFRGKMVAISHLIGPEQLPKASQISSRTMDWEATTEQPEAVTQGILSALAINCSLMKIGLASKCITLDPSKGERAMIIKNGQGDWGIVKAVWSDFKKGIPPGKGGSGIQGDPGHMRALFYDLRNDRFDTCTLLGKMVPSGLRDPCFKIRNLEVDMQYGEITIDTTSPENVAENLAMAFSLTVLFILCEPRPQERPGAPKLLSPLSQPIVLRGGRAIETLDAHLFPAILASGYATHTPSNSWIFWHTKLRHNNRKPELDRDSAVDSGTEEDRSDGLDSTGGCSSRSNGTSGEEKRCTCDMYRITNEGDLFCPWNPEATIEEMHRDVDPNVDSTELAGCGGCSATCVAKMSGKFDSDDDDDDGDEGSGDNDDEVGTEPTAEDTGIEGTGSRRASLDLENFENLDEMRRHLFNPEHEEIGEENEMAALYDPTRAEIGDDFGGSTCGAVAGIRPNEFIS